MSIVEDGLVLVGVGLDETADDRACELLGHAAVTDIIHVQVVCREIKSVAPFTLKFAHRIEAVNQQDPRLAGDARNRSNDLLVVGILHQGFPALGIPLLVGSCLSPGAPIPLRGDAQAHAGQWIGVYTSTETGRTGSIQVTVEL